MFDLLVVSEDKNGRTAITSFAPEHIENMLRGFLKTKYKPEYVDSISKEEALSLLSKVEIDAITNTIIDHDARKIGLKNIRIIDRSDIPKDRYFRDALKHDLTVDMDKAREIQMDKIRFERNERLHELDKSQYGSEYDVERQELRDIPQTFDLSGAKTPEELKALWPQQLSKGK